MCTHLLSAKQKHTHTHSFSLSTNKVSILMATLQKFKLLATQCAVSQSPTLSPTASPVVHRRRRKKLRRFLAGAGGRRRLNGCDESAVNSAEKGKESMGVKYKLKDLFVSSPPLEEMAETGRLLPVTNTAGWRRVGLRSMRPLSSLRGRLLRRSVWRPVLVTIPE